MALLPTDRPQRLRGFLRRGKRPTRAKPASRHRFESERHESIRKPDLAAPGGMREIPTAARSDLRAAAFRLAQKPFADQL